MRPSRRIAARGFTLVEVLIAMLIAGLILGVVYTLYHTVTMAVSGRKVRDDGLARAGRALEGLCADLSALFMAPSEDGAVRLGFSEAGDTNRSDLVFCALRLPGGETDSRWLESLQVRYRVEAEGGRPGVLLCETRPLAGPGAEAVETNALLEGVEVFRVSLFDGTEWRTEWSNTAEKIAPRSARIELETGRERRAFRTEVLIPAGSVFTSRLTRATAAP